jgi:hypothetical protein
MAQRRRVQAGWRAGLDAGGSEQRERAALVGERVRETVGGT